MTESDSLWFIYSLKTLLGSWTVFRASWNSSSVLIVINSFSSSQYFTLIISHLYNDPNYKNKEYHRMTSIKNHLKLKKSSWFLFYCLKLLYSLELYRIVTVDEILQNNITKRKLWQFTFSYNFCCLNECPRNLYPLTSS